MAEGSAHTTNTVHQNNEPGLLNRFGIVLTRFIVPVWVLAGATFKLVEGTPKKLPPSLYAVNMDHIHLRPHIWLALLIGLEFFAVGVMFFSRRFARMMAIFMLACFCGILLNEMRLGNLDDCGCFGNLPIKPWVTLCIDGALLIGVLVCVPKYRRKGLAIGAQLAAALLWAGVGFALSFLLILPRAGTVTPLVNDGTTSPQPDGNQDPRPPLTGAFYIDPAQVESWIDQPWTKMPLFQFNQDWPEGMSEGRRYVLFIHRTCEHCRDMLENHFDEAPPVPTVVVAIPDSRSGFDTGNALMMIYAEDDVDKRELPIGPDWVLTGPIVVALEDGLIRCFKEGDDPAEPACLIWH